VPNGARHRFADLGPCESCAECREPISGDGQHAVHRRFEFELPVSAVGLQAEKPDIGDVDSVLAVNPDETVGLQKRRDLADGSDIEKRCARSQADFGLATSGSKAVDVVRIKDALFAAEDMDENSGR